MQDFIPGHYPGVSNDDYHNGPGVSKSHLDKMAVSPAFYRFHYRKTDEEKKEVVEEDGASDKNFGTAFHTAVLEPDLLSSTVVIAPTSINKRTKVGKQEFADFMAQNKHKVVVDVGEHDLLLKMRDAVHRHPVARHFARADGGMIENSFYGYDPKNGLLRKCRPDKIIESGELIIDLKSTKDASPRGFALDATNYTYYLQPPWYLDTMELAVGWTAENFVFLAVEKEPPFQIGIYYAQQHDIELARAECQRLADLIAECDASGYWYDYTKSEAMPLDLPPWTWRK
jgi:exodeoxyribonuclease VIII